MMQRKICSSLKKYRYGGWFTTTKDNPIRILWFNPCNKRGKIVIATEPCVFIGGLSIDLHSGNIEKTNKILFKSIFYLVEYESTKQVYDLGISICDLESTTGNTQSSYCEPLGGCLEDGIVIEKGEDSVTVACGPTVYDLPISYFNDTVELLQCASFTLNAPRGIAAIDHKSGEFSVWDLCTWDVDYPKLKFAPWLAKSGFYYYYSPACSLANSRVNSRNNSICDDNIYSRSNSMRNSINSNSSTYYSSSANELKRKRKNDSSSRLKKYLKKQSGESGLLYSEVVKIPKIESIT